MDNIPILQVKNLSVDFRTKKGVVRAVRDTSFSVDKRQISGLAGESGSGKSTIALAIMRYLGRNGRITQGQILFKGKDILKKSEDDLRKIRGNEIAMVYQDPQNALNPSVRTGKQIAETMQLHQHLSRKEAWKRSLELLAMVNMPDPLYNAKRYPHQLSGGMQQRVIIAMALSCNPSLLIMDEPTTGLDVTIQARIIDLVVELKEQINASILYITHDLSVIAHISDRVAIIYAGEIVESGPVDEIFYNTSHPYTKGLLDAIPKVDSQEGFKPIKGKLPDIVNVPPGCIFASRCDYEEKLCTKSKPILEAIHDTHYVKCFKKVQVQHIVEKQRMEVAGPLRRGLQQTQDTLLEVERLAKYFGDAGFFARLLGFDVQSVKAVDNISLDIKAGEILALIGESGCGKSTLGLCLLKLLRITDGQIRFEGQNLERLSKRELRDFRKASQIVFQHPDSSLNPRRTIGSILQNSLKPFGIRGPERKERVARLLEAVNLDRDYQYRRPRELSGGEKQRIAIARAFALAPQFVVLDECTSSLDVSIQASILRLLIELQEETHSSYLFISHDLSVVRHIADRIGVMYLGKLVEIGKAEDIFNPPYHPYTKALLSSILPPEPSPLRHRIRLEGPVPSARKVPSGCRFHTRCPDKIGSVCEKKAPPLTEAADEHYIACWTPIEELEQEQSVI